MRHALSALTCFAICAVALGLSAAPGAAAADLRVMGQLALTFGSRDWSASVQADLDARERWVDRLESSSRPVMDLTARFSGPGGRFESLRFNGLPVVSPRLVLRAADATGEEDSGVRWEYVALGLAGVAAIVLLIRDEAIDVTEDVFEDN